MPLPNPFTPRLAPRPLAMCEAAARQLAAQLASDPQGRAVLATDPAKALLLAAAEAEARSARDVGRRTAFADADAAEADAVDAEAGYVIEAGAAIFRIQGPLWREGYRAYWSGDLWRHGYDTLRAGLAQAQADPRVRGVLLAIDSPGGLVDGCADCADAIYATAQVMPVFAHCAYAASAAYWLASQASHVVADRDGEVGSIGTVVIHASEARWLDRAGIDVTPITFGARKADGHPALPLSEEAARDIQAGVDEHGRRFVDAVARGRGLAHGKVLATEARTFHASHRDPDHDAQARGLIDDVASFEVTLAALQAEIAA